MALLLGVLLPCARAAADGVESVRLSIPDCAEISGAQIRKLVALELASRENITLEESDAGLEASLRCDGDRTVISVRDPSRAEPLVLEMQIGQTRREARPRLLALAIVELIATSRFEQAPAPAPARIDDPAPPPEPRESVFTVWLGGGVLREYEPRSWPGALAAGAAYSFGPMALAAELGFDWTSHSANDAEVRARSLSIAIAPSLTLVDAPLEWSVSLGVRLGYAWLQASSRSVDLTAGTVSSAYVAPLAATSVSWHVARAWYVRASLELGYVLTPVRGLDADRQRLLELSGYRAAGLLGIGLDL